MEKAYQLEPHRLADRNCSSGDGCEYRGKRSLYGCLQLPDRPRHEKEYYDAQIQIAVRIAAS